MLDPTSSRHWLELAQDDLRAARKLLADEDGSARLAAYLAQQAAEKAIKAALVDLQFDFPFSHNLDQLVDLLPDSWPTKSKFPDLARLSQWAVDARYPGDWTMPTETDAVIAVEEAAGVIESIEAELDKRHTGCDR